MIVQHYTLRCDISSHRSEYILLYWLFFSNGKDLTILVHHVKPKDNHSPLPCSSTVSIHPSHLAWSLLCTQHCSTNQQLGNTMLSHHG